MYFVYCLKLGLVNVNWSLRITSFDTFNIGMKITFKETICEVVINDEKSDDLSWKKKVIINFIAELIVRIIILWLTKL